MSKLIESEYEVTFYIQFSNGTASWNSGQVTLTGTLTDKELEAVQTMTTLMEEVES